MDIARLSESLPKRRCLVGIEPASVDWGEAPSEKVEKAIELGIREIASILMRWRDKETQ
jgi:hydrogenase maturation protease